MKILVCFKIIPDLDQMAGKDYITDGQMQVDTSFVRSMWNCFDESGLEFGLRLSDEAEGLNLHLEKTAFTVAGEQAELYLKTLSALRYEQTVRVNDTGQDLRFAPEQVAEIVAQYGREHPQDFILMGCQSSPGNQGLTPFYTAHKLSMPIVSGVIDMHITAAEELEVVTEEAGTLYTQRVKAPALLSIGNAVISKLRVPTLKDRMKYGKQEATLYNASEWNRELQYIPASLTYLNRERKGDVLSGEGAADELFQLYQQIRKGSECV